ASQNHIVDLGRIDAWRAAKRLGDDDRAELVGPGAAQCPSGRFARRGSDRGHDDSFMHSVLTVRLKPDTTDINGVGTSVPIVSGFSRRRPTSTAWAHPFR